MNNTNITNDKSYIYRIDKSDNIIYLSDNWSDFALANDAATICVPQLILGKSLWSFIADFETRHIYGLMLTRVRETLEPAVIPINCDSPELKRVFQISMTAMNDGAVEFSSTLVEISQRQYIKILDRSVIRSEDIVKICSFCKKIAVSDSEWAETSEAIKILNLFGNITMPLLSHGVCPSCYASITAEMDRQKSM
jgi:hypothetical protein